MADFRLKNESEREVQEQILRQTQSTGMDLLDDLQNMTATMDARVKRTAAELVFKQFAGKRLDSSTLQIIIRESLTYSNTFGRQLLNATLATCLPIPAEEEVEALQVVAKNAHGRHPHDIEELAGEHMVRRNEE